MSQLLQSIMAKYPLVAREMPLDEVSAPTSSFDTSREPSLPMMAKITDRWAKVGPSVIAAVRGLADTVQGQEACSLLHSVTHMPESALAWAMKGKKQPSKLHVEGWEPDEIDELVIRRAIDGFTIVHPIAEGNNDSIPQGVHASSDPALSLQELHIRIGKILPELHALVTSTVGPEKAALSMLFHEVNTAHNDLQNILSCSSQESANMSGAHDHFSNVYSQLMGALSPYTTSNPAVSRAPYQFKGASLGE